MATAYYLNQYFTTTLNVGGGINNSQTTGIIAQAVSGIDINKPGIACLSYTDPLDTSIAEWFTYTSIDGSNEFQGVTRGQEGFSAKTHANGVTIAFPLSETHINNLATALSIGGIATNAVSTTLDEDNMATNSATALATQQSIKSYVDTQLGTVSAEGSLFENALINSNFDVWETATSYDSTGTANVSKNDDDNYFAEIWNLISDGNDTVDITRSTDKPDGSTYSAKFDVQTSKRFGIVQFIPNVDTLKLDNKAVSLSFAAKTDSSEITTLRAAVLTWGSTADTVTSDVVGTWGATPTWAANWTQENTPSDITITNSWATYEIENINIDSGTVNNIAVVIWSPNEESVSDTLYLSQIKLNQGTTAKTYQPRSYIEELISCRRYIRVFSSAALYHMPGNGTAISTTVTRIFTPLNVRLRTVPTLIATATDWQVSDGVLDTDVTAISLNNNWKAEDSVAIDATVASGLTQYRPYYLQADSNAGRKLILDARL